MAKRQAKGKRSYEIDMCNGPLLGKILRFAVPLMLSSVLQLFFNAADIVVVGRFTGHTALAAVGSTGALINLLINVFIGLSIGTNVLVARYYGAQDAKQLSETVHTSVLTSLVSGVILIAVGVAFAEPLLTLMGTPEDVLGQAALYMRIYFVGMPAMMLYNFGAAILRSVGDTKRPLYFLTVAGVINVVLNLIFVIGCHLSVAGVALATIISQAISALLVTRALLNMEGPTRLFLNRLRIHPGKLREIIRIGLPAGIQSSVFSLSNVVIQSSVNSFGSVVIAGNAASSNVGNFVYQAMNTFQQAITCFAGQNIGARKPRRIVSAMKVCMFWAVSFGLVLGMLSCVFGTQLLSLFSADPAVIAAGMERQIIVCAPYFLCGMMDVMTGALRGIGYSLLPMIVSILGACAFRLFWVFTVFAAYPTLPCLMLSYPVSWLLTFSVLLVIFLVLWNRSFVPQFTREEMERA